MPLHRSRARHPKRPLPDQRSETPRWRRTLWLGLAVSLGALSALSAGAVQAQVFYDNLGTLDIYDDTDVVSFVGQYPPALGGDDWFQGFRVTAEATGTLHSIDVAVGNYFSGPETIEFRLYADAGGALGAQLATIPVVAVAEDFDGTIRRGFVEPSVGGNPMLTQGSGYWLMATAPSATIWFKNEQGDTLPRLWTPDGPSGTLRSDTVTAAALRLNGAPPVPIAMPPGMILLTALLSATGALALRSHSARIG